MAAGVGAGYLSAMSRWKPTDLIAKRQQRARQRAAGLCIACGQPRQQQEGMGCLAAPELMALLGGSELSVSERAVCLDEPAAGELLL